MKELILRNDERGAIVGQTGTGKSVLATQLILHSRRERIGIIDPKRMFNIPDDSFEVFDNPKLLTRRKPKRFIYRPKPERFTSLGDYELIYQHCYNQGNMLVYTDDVVGIIDKSRYPNSLAICYMMGRAKNISMLASFQRPAWLPLFLCSESSKFYIFRLTLGGDIKRVSEFVEGYDTGRLADKHTFMFKNLYNDYPSKPYRLNLVK